MGIEALIPEQTVAGSSAIENAVEHKSTLVNLLEVYFGPKDFEKSGKLYEGAGVHIYKKFLPSGGDYVSRFVLRPLRMQMVNRDKNAMENYEVVTRVFEAFHTLCGALMLPGMIDCYSDGDIRGGTERLVANLIVNIYPVMVQRYNRARIYRYLEKHST